MSDRRSNSPCGGSKERNASAALDDGTRFVDGYLDVAVEAHRRSCGDMKRLREDVRDQLQFPQHDGGAPRNRFLQFVHEKKLFSGGYRLGFSGASRRFHSRSGRACHGFKFIPDDQRVLRQI
jgi:hypothetical protein